MEVRLTIKTTPGRPVRAILVMAALTLLAALLAWALTVYKRDRPIRLGDPVELPGLWLGVAAPIDWPGLPAIDPTTGLVATFYDPAFPPPGAGRGLLVYRLDAPPAAPEQVLAEFGRLLRVHERRGLVRTRIGPLPACQMVVTTVAPGQVRTHILRAAVLGHDRYLLLQLDCLGPPTPWEQRLMDLLADSVALDPAAYPDPSRLAGHVGVDLGERAAGWLVSAFQDESADLTLLPRAGQTGVAGFWGLSHLTVLSAAPGEDLSQRLAAELAGGAGRDLVSIPPGRQAATPAAARLILQAVQERAVGPIAAWRVRGEERDTVRVVYIFRAIDPDGAELPDRAVLVSAWFAAEDEPAATEAVEQLIRSIRLR